MTDLFQDFGYAVRMLRKNAVVSAIVIGMLALGIGANTAIFSVLNALLMRTLPYPQPEQLVSIESTHDGKTSSVGNQNFLEWKAQSTAFDAMAYTWHEVTRLTGQSFPGFGEAEQIAGTQVSADFFRMLGVQPLVGRWLLPEEQSEGHNRVIVLSYELWVRRFGARPDIIGQSLTLDRRSYTIVGVMPRDFRFRDEGSGASEYWIPLQFWAWGRMIHQYQGYGRLKPGVTIAEAHTQLSAVARRQELAYPDSNTGWGVRVTSLRRNLLADMLPAIEVLFAAVAMVLLIACANVANLLLARTTTRAREIAVRRALGAGRWSIVRLLLSESLALSVVACLAGLLLARWAMDVMLRLAPPWLELKPILYVDYRVLAFALLMAVATGVLTGIIPALHASRGDPNENLKQGGGGGGAPQRARALSTLVTGEVALAVVMLVASGLLIKSFVRLLQVDLGFRTDHLLTFYVDLPRADYADPARRAEFFRTLLERLRGLPGVSGAGAAAGIPLGGYMSMGPVEIQGKPVPRDWMDADVAYRTATPDYFRTLAIPLLRGRSFNEQDRTGSEPVVIVNEALARKFFPGEDPLGRKIRAEDNEQWQTIVGVVGDVRPNGPEGDVIPERYRPSAQEPLRFMSIAVRTMVPAATLAAPVRAELRRLDPELVPGGLRTMEDALTKTLAPRRQIMALVSLFGAVALLMAALGLGGVMWYTVSRRTHEIGVRMALGACPEDMLRYVLARGMRLTATGVVFGLVSAAAVTRLLGSLLYAVGARDTFVFASTPVLLILVALLACYVPARRATKVDPMQALRYE